MIHLGNKGIKDKARSFDAYDISKATEIVAVDKQLFSEQYSWYVKERPDFGILIQITCLGFLDQVSTFPSRDSCFEPVFLTSI